MALSKTAAIESKEKSMRKPLLVAGTVFALLTSACNGDAEVEPAATPETDNGEGESGTGGT